MIFFLICADEEAGRRECRERGWTQSNVNRFYTPERNDVRVVRRFVDFALLPGGTWFMAGADFHLNPNAGEFQKLVTGGQAKWIPGEEPQEPVKSPPPPPDRGSPLVSSASPTPAPPPLADPMANQHQAEIRESFRERYRAELLSRGSSGARPGRAPSQQ